MQWWINNTYRRINKKYRTINIMDRRISNMQRKVFSVAAVLAIGMVGGWTGAARAQCEPQWLPGEGAPGVDGTVYAVKTWDPDGAGPEPEVLVVGGNFTIAGDVFANRIAYWDGTNWFPLGSGMNDWVIALTVYNDDLIAGGFFTTAGSMPCNYIARWDGSTWQPLGEGVNDWVVALTVFNGELTAGGFFTTAGGVPCTGIAKWTGANWASVGGGLGGAAQGLTVYNGELIAGGLFTSAGGVPCNNIARWDGSDWHALGSGMTGGTYPFVWTLTVVPNGDLIAGGLFTTAGGVLCNNVARWDGSDWHALGGGMTGGTYLYVLALTALPNGHVIAGGSFVMADGVPCNNIARWDGATWHPLGSGVSGGYMTSVWALTTLPSGDLVAGGDFTSAGGVPCNRIARWDSPLWYPLGRGMDAGIRALAPHEGRVFAGGDFIWAGAAPAQRVAVRENGVWSPVGDGMNDSVSSLAWFDDGQVAGPFAGGTFTEAGGQPASRVARWDGADWQPLAGGTNRSVNSLHVFDDGSGPRLYVGGEFTRADGRSAGRLATWSEDPQVPGQTQWSYPFSPGDFDALVTCLAWFDDGSGLALYAGGEFTRAGGVDAYYLAKWDGAAWSEVGGGMNAPVYALVVFDDGHGPALFVGGNFTFAGTQAAKYLARWDGINWAPVPGELGNIGCCSGAVSALAVFDDGQGDALYVGGEFTTIGGVTFDRIARWDGVNWSPLEQGLNDEPLALVVHDDGTGPALFAGGFFTTAGSVTVNRVAKWNGQNWSALGTGMNAYVSALAEYDDGTGVRLYAGGAFTTADGQPVMRLAVWDPVSGWAQVDSGSGRTVNALLAADLGAGHRLYVGTDASILLPQINELLVWDGVTLASAGTINSHVRALAAGGSGLYVGGWFTKAGGTPANKVARFDGVNWAPVGSADAGNGLSAWCSAMASVGPTGVGSPGRRLFVGGGFFNIGSESYRYIASWDGAAWEPLGSGLNGTVTALLVFEQYGQNVLIAGGHFWEAGGVPARHIAQWDGSAWHPLGQGMNGVVRALAILDHGSGPQLYAAGDFTEADGMPAQRIARWNGTNWLPLDGGMNAEVYALTVVSNELSAGGYFTRAGDQVSAFFARWGCLKGACCFATGACEELTEADCLVAGGDWQGIGTACDPNPCVTPGDVNCDGHVNFGDINPFVLLLTNPAGWQALYPDCPLLNGDCNGDGRVDFGDINPFVRLLTGP